MRDLSGHGRPIESAIHTSIEKTYRAVTNFKLQKLTERIAAMQAVPCWPPLDQLGSVLWNAAGDGIAQTQERIASPDNQKRQRYERFKSAIARREQFEKQNREIRRIAHRNGLDSVALDAQLARARKVLEQLEASLKLSADSAELSQRLSDFLGLMLTVFDVVQRIGDLTAPLHTKSNRTRGAPPKYDPAETKRIYEAWQTGTYRTYADLAGARRKGEKPSDIRKAVNRQQKREKAASDE
jgi:hypothetical protein